MGKKFLPIGTPFALCGSLLGLLGPGCGSDDSRKDANAGVTGDDASTGATGGDASATGGTAGSGATGASAGATGGAAGSGATGGDASTTGGTAGSGATGGSAGSTGGAAGSGATGGDASTTGGAGGVSGAGATGGAAGTGGDASEGGVPLDSCCTPKQTPYCSVPEIADCVCAADWYCCLNQWDSICVHEMIDLGCGSCSMPPCKPSLIDVSMDCGARFGSSCPAGYVPDQFPSSAPFFSVCCTAPTFTLCVRQDVTQTTIVEWSQANPGVEQGCPAGTHDVFTTQACSGQAGYVLCIPNSTVECL